MGFLNALNISASGMTAQRMRLDVAAANITNINTTRTENGEPYRRKMVVFESIEGNSFEDAFRSELSKSNQLPGGVRVAEIVEDQSDFRSVYNPEHPDADENGYIRTSNVDPLVEITDAIMAQRAYEASLAIITMSKSMADKAATIGS